MASKSHRPTAAFVADAARERTVQREIDDFLRALTSYPESFARQPHLSFEQHLFRIMAAGHASGTGAQRHAL